MRRQQCVHTAAGAHQVHVRIKDAGAQRTGEHAGQVHAGDARRSVHHFQRQTDQQLDDQIEAQMEPAGVQHHVEQEAPHLLALVGAVDEYRVDGHGTGRIGETGGQCVVGEKAKLLVEKKCEVSQVFMGLE